MTKRLLPVVVALFGVLLLAAIGLFLGHGTVSSTPNQQGSTTIFSDTFTTMLPIWDVTDLTSPSLGYQWGLTPYSRTVGSESVTDQGLWGAGGGVLGEAQTWPTGTYTNGMMTLAKAGPFTLSQPAAEVVLSAKVLNESASGEMLIVALSRDGTNPLSSDPVPSSAGVWQEISRSTGPFMAGEQVWVFMLFVSDGSGVDTGPLVDDIRLDAVYSHDIYLPLVQLDPTPTPLPIYMDDFSNANSGWKTGWVQRYNVYWRGETYYSRWENVANLAYTNGNYRITVPMDWRGGGDQLTWFVWPAEIAPLPSGSTPLPDSYCVEARARFANSWEEYQPWWAHWGLVFAANAAESGTSLTEIYTFQINANHALGMVRYHNYVYPGDRQPVDGTDINVEMPLYRWPGNATYEYWSKEEFGNPTAEYNVLKVWVHGTQAAFYVNGRLRVTADIPDMPRAGVGIIGGSYEVTPVDVDFDYFRYDPTCTGP